MAMTILNDDFFLKAIESEIRAAIEERIKEVTEGAAKEIEKTLCEKIDSMALRLLKHYSVYSNEQEIVIRVIKGTP